MFGADKTFHFKAFISYSHQDRQWAEWLHKTIENYSLPQHLVGASGRDGSVPKRLSPVFRDREELPSSHDLSEQIARALDQSAYLIVICSPDGAYSHWVNEEILAFKRLGKESRILALIVGGEPNASDTGRLHRECFPNALRFGMDMAGKLTTERREPIAADLRPGGDGRRNAALKIIAGLLGVGFDDLVQRERKRAMARRRLILGTAAAIALTAIGGAASTYEAFFAKHTHYYVNFKTLNGVPEGVGNDLSWDLASHRQFTYRFTKQNHKTIELRLVNGSGKSQEFNQYDEARNGEFDGVAHLIFRYGEDGRVSEMTARDTDDYVKYVAKYAYDKPGEAHVSLRSAGDQVYTLTEFETRPELSRTWDDAPDNTPISGYVLKFDSLGRTVQKLYRDASGKAQANLEGSYGLQYAYGKDDLIERMSDISAEGKPFPHDHQIDKIASHGYQSTVFDYVTTGRYRGTIASVSYLDEHNRLAGRPASSQPYLARVKYDYGRYGNQAAQSYYDQDGRPLRKESHSRINYKYDAKGNPVEETYFDIQIHRRVLFAPNSYAAEISTYDDQGEFTGTYQIDTAGKIFVGSDGVAFNTRFIKKDSDGGGIASRLQFLNKDRKLINSKEAGYATLEKTYDSTGYKILEAYLDVTGRPVCPFFAPSPCAVATRSDHDESGRPVSVVTLGPDGKPIAIKGFAEVRHKYDAATGRTIETEYYDQNGRAVVPPGIGYASVTYEYDSGSGRLTRTQYFDAVGSPIQVPSKGDYSAEVSSYYPNGRVHVVSYVDADDRPIIHKIRQYASVVYSYAATADAEEQWEHFRGLDNRPILTNYGSKESTIDGIYAGIHIVYDRNHKKTRIDYLGPQDHPQLISNGFDHVTFTYDPDENCVEEAFWAGDKPANGPDGYTRAHFVYDHSGRRIEEEYFAKDGTKLLATTKQP